MNTMSTDTREGSQEIAEDIRETRLKIDETLDELGDRFHPVTLLDEAVERWERIDKEQIALAARETGVAAKEHLYNHPLSSLVIAAGIGLFAYEKTRPSGKGVTAGGISQQSKLVWNNTVEGAYGAQQSAKEAIDQATHRTKEGIFNTKENIYRDVNHAKQYIQDGMTALSNKAGDHYRSGVEHTQTYAAQKRAEASQIARESGVQAKTYMQRGCAKASSVACNNPLAVGAGMMVLGVMAGILAPRTRSENKKFGRQSDAVKRRTLEEGQALMEHGQHIAEKAYASAKHTAEQEGLTSPQLAESAEHIIEDAKQTALSETKKSMREA